MKINENNADLRISAGLEKQFPRDAVPHVVFSGRSNVGKSSLINNLLNRKKLARVSSEPGKTVTVNFYDIDGKLFFVDLPGYGFARRSMSDKSRWSALTDSYLTSGSSRERIKLVLQLIDMKVGITADDGLMLDWLCRTGTPFIVVATKCDKLNKTERAASYEKISASLREVHGISEPRVIPYSSTKNEGKNEVWKEINAACFG